MSVLRRIDRHLYDPFGWLLRKLSRAPARRIDGIWLVAPTRLVPPRMYAWTVGHTILARGSVSERLWRHELEHVRQFERFGWTFPFRYLWSSLRTLSYRNNVYEIEAREAERRPA